jgi:hypothetical protein
MALRRDKVKKQKCGEVVGKLEEKYFLIGSC